MKHKKAMAYIFQWKTPVMWPKKLTFIFSILWGNLSLKHKYKDWITLFVPRLLRKWGTLNLIRLSVCPSVLLSVPLSVTKTLTWLISSEVLMIQNWYLVWMITVTSPFYWYYTVTLTFDLSQGLICCRAGDHNSSNLLVSFAFGNERTLFTCKSLRSCSRFTRFTRDQCPFISQCKPKKCTLILKWNNISSLGGNIS